MEKITFHLLSIVDMCSNPAVSSATYDVLPGFTRATAPPTSRKHYPPPQLPRDFQPYHKFESDLSSTSQSWSESAHGRTEKKKFDAYSRGAALGEVPHLSEWRSSSCMLDFLVFQNFTCIECWFLFSFLFLSLRSTTSASVLPAKQWEQACTVCSL